MHGRTDVSSTLRKRKTTVCSRYDEYDDTIFMGTGDS